jgi:O-antigen ligase
VDTQQDETRDREQVVAPGAATGTGAQRLTRAILLATAFALPLVFWLGFWDVFALPKLVAAYLLVTAALIGPIWVLAHRYPIVRPPLRRPDLAAGAFALLALAAWALAAAPGHDLQGEPLQYQGLLPLLLYVIAYALARFALDTPAVLYRFLAVVALAGGLVGAYAVIQVLHLDPIWHVLDRGRPFSSFGQANSLAAYLVLAIPGAVMIALTGTSRLLRLATAASLLLMGAALGLTLSRGGYLGLAVEVALALFLFLAARRGHIRPAGATGRWISLALLAVLLGLVGLAVLPVTREAAERVFARAFSSTDLAEGSIQDHLDLWAVGAAVTLDHPLVGTGPDSYVLVFPTYRDRVLPPAQAAIMARFRPESPHNVYLAFSSGLGLPALAAYLALVVGALVAAWRTRRTLDRRMTILGTTLLVVLAGHLITDAFMTGELAGSWLCWTLLGAAVALGGAGVPAGESRESGSLKAP